MKCTLCEKELNELFWRKGQIYREFKCLSCGTLFNTYISYREGNVGLDEAYLCFRGKDGQIWKIYYCEDLLTVVDLELFNPKLQVFRYRNDFNFGTGERWKLDIHNYYEVGNMMFKVIMELGIFA
jgi:phage FluMu protein Com